MQKSPVFSSRGCRRQTVRKPSMCCIIAKWRISNVSGPGCVRRAYHVRVTGRGNWAKCRRVTNRSATRCKNRLFFHRVAVNSATRRDVTGCITSHVLFFAVWGRCLAVVWLVCSHVMSESPFFASRGCGFSHAMACHRSHSIAWLSGRALRLMGCMLARIPADICDICAFCRWSLRRAFISLRSFD